MRPDAPTDPSAATPFSYVPALDGLRALAVLGVLVFHASPSSLRGGFAGVDVFFVLSGYLITSVIASGVAAGRFSLRGFYARRALRLLPNLVAVAAATLALYALTLLPSSAKRVAEHVPWVLGNLSNFYIWKTAGYYWGDAAASMPLLHTWSLAVEEQFYLFFPFLMLAAGLRFRLRVVAATTVLSLALFLIASRRHFPTAFFMLPTRAWEPLIGAVWALLRRDRRWESPPRLRAPLACIGLVMIVAGFFLLDEAAYAAGGALFPSIGAILLIANLGTNRGEPRLLLDSKAIVPMGKMSYSLYLWHWPCAIVFERLAAYSGRAPAIGRAVGVTIGIGLGVVAYFAIEEPLRYHGVGLRRRLTTLGIGIASCWIVSLLITHCMRSGAPSLFERPTFSGVAYGAGGKVDPAKIGVRFADVAVPAIPPELESTLA